VSIHCEGSIKISGGVREYPLFFKKEKGEQLEKVAIGSALHKKVRVPAVTTGGSYNFPGY